MVTEAERLEALRRYDLLDTPPEPRFDQIVELARTICAAPIALISLVDADRQWFKAKRGVSAAETTLDTSVCALAIRQSEVFEIADLSADPRTSAMSLVTGDPHMRFYAGAPLVTAEGVAIGSLCIIDTAPRPGGLTAEQRKALQFLAEQVMTLVQMREALLTREAALSSAEAARQARAAGEQRLRETEQRLRFLRELDEALQLAADAPAAMAAAARLLALKLGASRCAYADVDPDSDRFIIRDDYTVPGLETSAGVYNLDLFGSRAVADMRGGRTLLVRDVGAELAPADGREMFQSIGIDAIICCPLVQENQLVAMMAVHQDRPRDWHADEISLVETVVGRCWAHVQRIGAEARLRQSETRYRTLFEAVDVGFTIAEMKFDDAGRAVDYRLVEMNPAFERQTGMGGLVGKWVREAVPGLEEHWFESYGHVAATGEPIRFENYAEPMGRWFDVHAFVTGAAGENLVAILFNDITGRKRHEEALRQLNESLEVQVAERTAELRFNRDIIEATTSPICAFDTDLRLIAFNKAHNDEFRRVNGFDTRIGDVFPDLFIPDQAAKVRALMTRALSGEQFTVIEQFGRPEYGQPYWEISYTPLRDAGGRIIGAFHLANDISERLRAERDLAATQEALRQSQKMEAMGSLTGGVAHDFNNLLTPIIGGLDMLQRKATGGEREQRLIAGALQSAERAKTLVQRLLAFARRQPLQARAINVGDLVAGMADLVASTSGPQTHVMVDVPNDLPAALADQNQLEMAILNLSVNARDAMPDGGRLSISARAFDLSEGHLTGLAPGQYVRLSVADTGPGWMRRPCAARSSRSIRPRASARGPAWACRWCTDLLLSSAGH